MDKIIINIYKKEIIDDINKKNMISNLYIYSKIKKYLKKKNIGQMINKAKITKNIYLIKYFENKYKKERNK